MVIKLLTILFTPWLIIQSGTSSISAQLPTPPNGRVEQAAPASNETPFVNVDFSKPDSFESAPKHVERRIDRTYSKIYWRLILRLVEDEDSAGETELLPSQKDKIAHHIKRFRQFSSGIDERLNRAEKKLDSSKADDTAKSAFSEITRSSIREIEDKYRETLKSIESVLLFEQAGAIKARAMSYTADIVLPNNMPRIAKLVFISKKIGLADDDLTTIRKSVAEKIGSLNEKVVESENRAMKTMIGEFPPEARAKLLEFYGIDN